MELYVAVDVPTLLISAMGDCDYKDYHKATVPSAAGWLAGPPPAALPSGIEARTRRLAFAMINHPRLGAGAPSGGVGRGDVVALGARQIWAVRCPRCGRAGERWNKNPLDGDGGERSPPAARPGRALAIVVLLMHQRVHWPRGPVS